MKFPLYGAYNLYTPNQPNPYTQQWNVSLQRQFGTNWSLTLAYVGNKTTHQWIENENNPAIYIPGNNCTINGVLYSVCSTTANTEPETFAEAAVNTYGQYYGFMQTTVAAGNANYNAAVVTLNKRLSSNVSAQVLYTWSHCISIAEPGTINNHYDVPGSIQFSSPAAATAARTFARSSAVRIYLRARNSAMPGCKDWLETGNSRRSYASRAVWTQTF